ncbi:MAG: isocitrate/isopropylmalate dehydrogenase family protein [Bdellovibrionota bacterium]
MSESKTTRAVLIEGDGIGPEIVEAVLLIFERAGAEITWLPAFAGQRAVERFDDPLPEETLKLIKSTGVALKGPLTTEIGSTQGQAKGFRSLNVRLRKELDLYANLRPIKALPHLPTKFENVDTVIIRENTEGLYSGLEHEIVPGVVTSLKVATRAACLRIAEFAFAYAERSRRKKITGVHKANIMKLSDGLALECYRQVANQHPEIEYEERIVDATAMHLVMHPEQFDVLLMENLYGDILSDLAAGLIGGLGLAPSANIGTEASVFEAVHGSAPDIAGKGLANPTALLLSATQLLRHVGQVDTAIRIEKALFDTFADRAKLTPDLGGKGTTLSFAKAVCERLG